MGKIDTIPSGSNGTGHLQVAERSKNNTSMLPTRGPSNGNPRPGGSQGELSSSAPMPSTRQAETHIMRKDSLASNNAVNEHTPDNQVYCCELSEFEDESLYDLPSPSQLLLYEGEKGCKDIVSNQGIQETRQSNNNANTDVSGLSRKDPDWIDLEEWLNTEAFLEQPEARETRPAIASTPGSTKSGPAQIELSEDIWSPPQKRSVDDLGLKTTKPTNGPPQATSDSTLPATSPSFLDSPCGQKRKSKSYLEEIENERLIGPHMKRPKTIESPHCSLAREDLSHVRESTTSDSARHSADFEAPAVFQTPPATGVGISKGWEDIDPDLLEEFKDIVNFF